MARKAARHAEAERNDQALLAAAKQVLTAEGARASVSAIAARAGVGIASVYRRYRTKDELFQRLCVLAMEQWIEAAEQGLAMRDPWDGLVHYVTVALEFGGGSLGSLAGTVPVSDEMATAFTRSEELWHELVAKAHAAGVLRAEVTDVDISLLIEQLGKPSLVAQLEAQDRPDLLDAARAARRRVLMIALDGLRPGHPPLAGPPPSADLLTERWANKDSRET
ncbi:TetR/AcrR family transcriptional regulator [Nonomuraea sp. NBC_01738]|uniref:TetR/AcrR family transcriptional regulator n=1 Tax=Nonomuraea sp. NBC_01738 TaxID=2976003 RepID=UPI002E112710|nr:TetR/AcrR family transcriptional regulator [Nonomuraea sp. NBC_01738]